MRRATLSFLLAAAGLVLPSSVAQAAGPAVADAHATVEFKLRASNGLTAEVESSGDRITLSILGRRRQVAYLVRGAVSEAGVEARFGGLGRILVDFEPTRTLDSSTPPPECEGDPWTTKAGFFSGVIEFAGPGGYVTVDHSRARGTMRVTPDWKCHYARRGRAAARHAENADVATLDAGDRAGGRFFGALAVRDPAHRDYTAFFGGTSRRQGGMRIVSSAFFAARSGTFDFDHRLGTAAVSPPWPFSGSASFRREPGGSTSWTGSLRVGLLDRQGTVALTGPGFRARLVRDFPGD